jgi:hypothetical protein
MGCICERTMMISGRTSVISKGHLNRNWIHAGSYCRHSGFAHKRNCRL